LLRHVDGWRIARAQNAHTRRHASLPIPHPHPTQHTHARTHTRARTHTHSHACTHQRPVHHHLWRGKHQHRVHRPPGLFFRRCGGEELVRPPLLLGVPARPAATPSRAAVGLAPQLHPPPPSSHLPFRTWRPGPFLAAPRRPQIRNPHARIPPPQIGLPRGRVSTTAFKHPLCAKRFSCPRTRALRPSPPPLLSAAALRPTHRAPLAPPLSSPPACPPARGWCATTAGSLRLR
jgi:hypothetical protein